MRRFRRVRAPSGGRACNARPQPQPRQREGRRGDYPDTGARAGGEEAAGARIAELRPPFPSSPSPYLRLRVVGACSFAGSAAPPLVVRKQAQLCCAAAPEPGIARQPLSFAHAPLGGEGRPAPAAARARKSGSPSPWPPCLASWERLQPNPSVGRQRHRHV